MNHKASKYNYIYSVDGKYLVYNLLSDAIAVLDNESIGQLSNLQDAELLDDFCSVGFVVPEDVDELALVNSRRYATMFGEYETINFTILPTTGCNARCFYCYEEGWVPRSMNSATASAAAEFIAQECGANKRANVVWFGGEPLLGIDAIRHISDSLAVTLGNRFSATMVSNGYLLTSEIIGEAISRWKVSSMQVAIDGIYDVYEQRKAYAQGNKGSFERVMSNIEAALEAGIDITARINVDKNNIDSSSETLAYLAQRFQGYDSFDAYFYPLQDVGDDPSQDFFSEEEYHSLMPHLLEQRYRYGFIKNFDYATYPLVNAGCSARTLSSYVIDPDGDLYKCQHIVKDDCIGSVFGGPRFNDAYARFCDPSLPDECTECIFLPKCHGGCLIHHTYGNSTCPKCQMIKYDIEQRCEILYEMSCGDEA